MAENDKKQRKIAVINSLEEILTELDEQKLSLPALKIIEALEALGSTDAPD